MKVKDVKQILKVDGEHEVVVRSIDNDEFDREFDNWKDFLNDKSIDECELFCEVEIIGCVVFVWVK